LTSAPKAVVRTPVLLPASEDSFRRCQSPNFILIPLFVTYPPLFITNSRTSGFFWV